MIIFPVTNFKSASSFCDEYQAVYDEFTTAPDEDVAAAMNTMVAGLVSDGVWTKLDAIWVFATHTNDDGEALLNWKNPGTYTATENHAPVWTAYEGFVGDEANDYLDLGWNPTANGSNFTQNDASFGYYSRTNRSDTNTDMGCESGSVRTWAIPSTFGSEMSFYFNSAGNATTSNSNSDGMFVYQRTGVTAMAGYRNNVEIVSDVDVSNGIPNVNMYALCRNDDGVATDFCLRQLSMCFVGSSLTSDDRLSLQTRFEVYMDSNSKGVIS